MAMPALNGFIGKKSRWIGETEPGIIFIPEADQVF